MHRAARVAIAAAVALATPVSAQRLILPASAMMDEVVPVKAVGARPGQLVYVRAEMRDSSGRVWRSAITVRADRSGRMDLTRQAPESGSYSGVDPMGLITAMDDETEPARRTYAPADPYNIRTWYFVGTGAGVTDSAVVMRHFLRPGVRADSVPGLPVGTALLFLPPGSKRAPAVLVLGGSEGGLGGGDVAALLASRGYVALAMAYFGAPGLPSELGSVPLEGFERAITQLTAHPRVLNGAVGVLGTSKGAEAALLVAARDSRIRAVVAYAPSSVAWSCICRDAPRSSWTWRGEPVPAVPPGLDPAYSPRPGEPRRSAIHYRHRLQSVTTDDAVIEVERIGGPIMLVAGGADELWPSAEMATSIQARRRLHGRDAQDVVLLYPHAGHRIQKAYLPAGATVVAGGRLETGGTPRANAAAQAASWPRALNFLAEHLPPR